MDSERIQLVVGSQSTPNVEDASDTVTWWGKYRLALENTGLSKSAIEVLDLDSAYIIDKGIFAAGDIDDSNSKWPPNRLRRGLAMGAVQSGKTASMVAVAAKSLDRAVDVVVILAGTRIALWRQSYERVVTQLDGWNAELDSDRRSRRVFVPSPTVFETSLDSLELNSLYFETPNMVRRMLVEKRPLVAVVMKHADHLMHFTKFLHDVLANTFPRAGRPIHMLVIDDEADDGSILDSAVESGLALDSDGLKQIPRHIARLWSRHSDPHETFSPNLFATYLAYTATPQANFLQSDHNPLSPTDFLVALRTPFDTGSISPPRSTTFSEPDGVARYYTGGELFYRRLADEEGSLCVTERFPQRDKFDSRDDFEFAVEERRESLVSDALRAYFVSGAIRLHQTKKSLVSSQSMAPDSVEAILEITPSPHSMLFHPAARIDTHFLAAKEIAAWSKKFATEGASKDHNSVETNELLKLDSAGLVARLHAEDDLWKRWLIQFEKSRVRLSFWPSGGIFSEIDVADWPTIRKLLIDEVFPSTRIAVINSDPRADDRPHFAPTPVGNGKFSAPRDVYTIFISGNVMSRGITLEGLSTTLFLRSANEPLADTQMQMQRWFGYRGKHVCWCRVFMFDDQLDLFRRYHENDEALRSEIIGEMNDRPGIAPNPLVLQGARYRATGKIANLRALPLCPGADPFVRVVERGEFAALNTSILANLLKGNEWEPVVVGGILRGTAMRRQLDLLEVAELLESFRYSEHVPSPSGSNNERWRAIASEVGLVPPVAPLFRPPASRQSSRETVSPPNCPYSIAAYLRLWKSLLTRRARGIFPTDDSRTPWSMINLSEYAKSAPKFYVGLRYGDSGLSSDPQLASFGVLRMARSSMGNVLQSTWGSRNPGAGEDAYLGDQLFDYHVHGGIPPLRLPGEPMWRKRGAPGLVLFHVIKGEGEARDAVTVGLALPAGGPDHIAALRPRG